jgi:hypothetical protein
MQMPAGGLMQLLAYGAQDVYLTDNSDRLDALRKQKNEIIMKAITFILCWHHSPDNELVSILPFEIILKIAKKIVPNDKFAIDYIEQQSHLNPPWFSRPNFFSIL